jgi:anti-sigma-K factor RskA
MADQEDKDPDKDLDAGERALGTEPRGRESAAERRARQAWDDRLAPLALAAPPAEPPAGLFERIVSGIDGERDTAKIIQLAERRARRWRALAVASGAVAAGLALWIAAAPLGLLPPEEAPARNYVALVTPEGGSGPAMIVEVDIGTGVATVRALRVSAPQGRTLELWRIPPGAAPQSLGLVDPDQATIVNVTAEAGDVMAITVEPPGGAPGGVPSGPPILSGPLVATR